MARVVLSPKVKGRRKVARFNKGDRVRSVWRDNEEGVVLSPLYPSGVFEVRWDTGVTRSGYATDLRLVSRPSWLERARIAVSGVVPDSRCHPD